MKCPECQAANLPDAKFCDTCGLQLRAPRAAAVVVPPPIPSVPTIRHCPDCSHVVSVDDALCFSCGKPLPWSEAPKPVAPLRLVLEMGNTDIPYPGHEMLSATGHPHPAPPGRRGTRRRRLTPPSRHLVRHPG